MWLSVRALSEVQTDRKFRQMPHLAFEIGGETYPIVFEKRGAAVSGIDPKYTSEVFKDIPENAESVVLTAAEVGEDGSKSKRNMLVQYGRLRNYGTGPALSTWVTWIPQNVNIGGEILRITEE